MAKKLPTLNLPSADDLFTTQAERDDVGREKVLDIPLADIDAFPDHPFQVKKDESMQSMVDSVKAVGIQTPAVVRCKDDGRYEMVSGHRRKLACELAGLESMPCIVRDMSQDEAIIAMVDSNLQREVILPSEKAKSYKMRLDAMNRQAGRPKQNNLTPVVSYLREPRTNEELGEIVGESREQIRRYIRLTELVPKLLDMVDESRLPMRPAVELSYLSQEHQLALLDAIEAEDRAPSHVQATKLRKFFEEGNLNSDMIFSVMQEDSSPVEQFKMPRERIQRFFPTDTSTKVIEDTIIKALELWRTQNK